MIITVHFFLSVCVSVWGMSYFAADASLKFLSSYEYNFILQFLYFHCTHFSQEKEKSRVPNCKALLQSSYLKDNHSVNLYPSGRKFRMWLKERESRFLPCECVSVYSREIRESDKHLHAWFFIFLYFFFKFNLIFTYVLACISVLSYACVCGPLLSVVCH